MSIICEFCESVMYQISEFRRQFQIMSSVISFHINREVYQYKWSQLPWPAVISSDAVSSLRLSHSQSHSQNHAFHNLNCISVETNPLPFIARKVIHCGRPHSFSVTEIYLSRLFQFLCSPTLCIMKICDANLSPL